MHNEDNEFELILGNRELLQVLGVFVILLALCFLMWYVAGGSLCMGVSA